MPLILDFFGSILSKMDQKDVTIKSCHIYNGCFILDFLDPICPKLIKLDQTFTNLIKLDKTGFLTNQKMVL